MLENNLDTIQLKIVKKDASEDDYIGFDWFRDDKYFDEIWVKYIFKDDPGHFHKKHKWFMFET